MSELEFRASAYGMRHTIWKLQQELLKRRREQDLAEREYLRTLRFTDQELVRYQQRILGVERRLERKLNPDAPLLPAQTFVITKHGPELFVPTTVERRS